MSSVASFGAWTRTAATSHESARAATLAMVFDFHGVTPKPARDKRVRLPREDRTEMNPPTPGHVAAVHRLLPVAMLARCRPR